MPRRKSLITRRRFRLSGVRRHKSMGLIFKAAARARSTTTTFDAAETTSDATEATAPASAALPRAGDKHVLNVATPGKPAEAQGKPRWTPSIDDPSHWTVEPSAEAVIGEDLLDAIAAVFAHYLVLPAQAAETLALWVVHTYVIDAGDISPILAVTSPTMRCGKTTLFKILAWLACRTEFESNVTPSSMFRYVHAKQPTLLIDEGETFLTEDREMRGILNSGHSRAGAYVMRTQGAKFVRFSTWGSKAIALNGKLPGTLADRSITVAMQRKKRSEQRPRYRDRDCHEFHGLRSRTLRWAIDNFNALENSDPKVPEALNDRAADNWRPLIAIADAAGGKWLEAARKAAVALVGTIEDDSADTQLLRDLRWLFDGKPDLHDGKMRREYQSTDRLFSQTIIDELNKIETSPWASWEQRRGFTLRDLANVLKAYGAGPETVRIGAKTGKGYYRAKLTDAFDRYLAAATAVTTSQSNKTGHNSQELSVTGASCVTDEIAQKPASHGHCDAVTPQGREDGRP
jgi:putative DNA primase/helicase